MPESYKEDGRPAQQWYWDDWFSAFDVRLCSLAARGLWIDMLGIMWKAEIRGTLTVNGRQIDNKTLAKIVNAPISEIKPLMKELEINNVFSRLEDGTIICRRVFRESGRKEQISKIRSKIGKKGAKERWKKMAKHSKLSSRNDSKAVEEKMAKMATSSSTPTSSPSSISSSKANIELRKQIIDHFNEITNQKRSYTCDGTNKLIIGRLSEGRTIDDFKHVIDTKTTQWLNDSKMAKFLRPSTLFRPGNFEDYLNEIYEDPRKKVLKVGESYTKEPEFLPMELLNQIYRIIDGKGGDKGKFYTRAKSAFPIIRTQWDLSDKTPETFIRLVEEVQ